VRATDDGGQQPAEIDFVKPERKTTASVCHVAPPPLNDGLSTTAGKTGIGPARWHAPYVAVTDIEMI
jgi:hypothetical protein